MSQNREGGTDGKIPIAGAGPGQGGTRAEVDARGAVQNVIPVKVDEPSHDECVGGDPDAEPARRFRIGGSCIEKRRNQD